MTQKEIMERIAFNEKLIEDALSPNIYTLNNTVSKLLAENTELQKLCKHCYEDGYCIYCHKSEED